MNQEDNIPWRFDFLKVEEVVSTYINLVSTSVSIYVRGYQILKGIRLLRVDIGVVDYIVYWNQLQ